MDMNHYMFQDQIMPCQPGDPNTEDNLEWSHDDVGVGRDMQWHRPYQVSLADNYNLPYPAHHPLHQPMIRPAMQPRLHPMHTTRRTPTENPQAIAQYPRPAIPGAMMGSSSYSSMVYSHAQAAPVLRQLHPSNEQLRSVPEMHPRMHRGMQYGTPPAHIGPLSVPMSRDISISAPTARPSRVSWTLELPKSSSTSSMSSPTKFPMKRTNPGNSTTPTTSPNKKIANLKNLPNRARTVTSRTEKSSIPAKSPEKENKPNSQRPINKGVRFVTASISDALRWRKDHVFSDIDRSNLLIEIVGTVFDIAGLQPIKISVHSQGIINGEFWETDHRLDRNVVLPGCLVKVVLRIPADGKDFHFLKVVPMKSSACVNAYRRIAYITGSSINQSKMA